MRGGGGLDSARLTRALLRGVLRSAALGPLAFPVALGAQLIQGTVVDARSEAGVDAVLVQLVGEGGEVVGASSATDGEGRFTMALPTAGTYRLRLTRIGYRETTTAPFELLAGDEQATVRVVLLPEVIALGDVLVEQQAQRGIALRGVALESYRMRERMGLGDFYNRERLEQWKDRPFPMTVGTFPGVVTGGASGRLVEVRRGLFTCAVRWYLDGIRVYPPPTSFMRSDRGRTSSVAQEIPEEIDILNTDEVEAVEFYRSEMAIPAEFGGAPGESTCAAIVVWTRRG